MEASGRQRDLLWGAPVALFLPRAPGTTVAPLVLAGAAQREQHERLTAGVHELAAGGGRHACQLVAAEHVLGAIEHERELTLEHQVDLLLVLVPVDPPALAPEPGSER